MTPSRSEDRAEIMVGGVNPVLEALRTRGASCRRLYVAKGRSGRPLAELEALAAGLGLRLEKVDRPRLDRLYGGKNHQGVVADLGSFVYSSLEEILDKTEGSKALLLILDGVQDPGNLGSLIRSAESAGAAGMILPRERAAPVTAGAIRVSAGAAEHLPVARVVNLARTIEEIKQAGFWVVGAEAEAGPSLFETGFEPRTALVVGGEDRGLRRLVREKCDQLVSIPLAGRTRSLNAAVAGAVILFEYLRQNP